MELDNYVEKLAKEYVDMFNDKDGLSDGDVQDILECYCLTNNLVYKELYDLFYSEVDRLQKLEKEQNYEYK